MVTRLHRSMTVAAALALLPTAAHAQTLRGQAVATGLTQPIAFVQDPSLPNVQFIVEQGGRIRPLVNGVLGADFLNLTGVVLLGGENGLLGLAFAPDYATSGRFYVNFTRSPDNATVVARFKRSAGNPLVADPATRFDLMWPTAPGLNPTRQGFIPQPFLNHNGGNLVFGPDGYLYIGMGDGGAGNDPGHLAQAPGTLLGKMLRIDVDVSDSDLEGYDVPPTNPFVAHWMLEPAVWLPEIWSFGLRNPWRYSFDDGPGGTGALIIADVGQGNWEEVNYEPVGGAGRNYGWRNREGAHVNGGVPALPGPYFTPLRDPIHEYDHTVGSVITGGVVYRGNNLGASYRGRYFFADFGFSRIWTLSFNLDANGEATVASIIEHTATLGAAAQNASHFGVDAAGEVYVVSYYSGTVYRLYLEFVTNGTFNDGADGWQTFATPNSNYIVGGPNNGVFEFYRVPPPPNETNQAVVFQRTGLAVPAGTRFSAEFYLGNSSTLRKRIAVLLHDVNFNDVVVCTFWLEAGTSLKAYRMYTHSIEAWTNATISFYAATPGFDGGYYQIDNVTVRPDFGVAGDRTDCIDPTAVVPPGGPPGPDLVVNGDFSVGPPPAPWGTFGTITPQVSGGVFEFVRPNNTPPAGVVLQETGVGFLSGSIMTATFELGNSSSVRKRVTVLLHDRLFEHLSACTFWLAPGQPLMAYQMRGFTPQTWLNATISFYAASIGPEQWIRLDNVTFRSTPDQQALGTECMEPPTPAPNPGGTTMALRRMRWFLP
jgi:glucose/arabinose dehydrogenase